MDGIGARLARALIRLLLRLFYRRIEVVGAERIPPEGPLILAANHHNSIVDAMILLAVLPRRLRTLAKAQLFAHPLIGPFLKLAGALPVKRRQEAGDDPRKNDGLFEATTATLRGGGALLIFPEGRTQPEPVLLELRTGAARMLLAAAPAPVTLLPVGLVFQDPGIFREAEALVLVGEPVPAQDLPAGDPEGAARELTGRLAQALRALIVEAPDLATLRLLSQVEAIWKEDHAVPEDGAARVAWLQQAMGIYHALRASAPERLEAFGSRLRSFSGELDACGLGLADLASGTAAGGYGADAFALLVGAPLALLGMALHGLPYRTTALAARLIPHTAEEDATDKLVAGTVFYPLFWLLEGWVLLHWAGGWALAAFLVALVPTAFFALAWQERLARVFRQARAGSRLARDPGLRQRLREEKEGLLAELAAFVQLAPDRSAP